jgi:hypothetical protein
LIRGLNPKFSVPKTLLPLLPKFPTFVEARELVLSDEASRAADSKCTSETALFATGGSTLKQDTTPPAPPTLDHPPPPNNNGGGRGHGRGGRNGDRGGGGRNNFNDNFNNATGWGQAWGGNRRASWSGAMGPGLGLLGIRPLPYRVKIFKPINWRPFKLLCRLPRGIPLASFKLFRQPLSNNPKTKVIGIWILVPHLT